MADAIRCKRHRSGRSDNLNLNVIGFEDLNTSLSIAYNQIRARSNRQGIQDIKAATHCSRIGDGAKSGAMIGYSFKIANELPEDNFMTDESIDHLESGLIENIVLVDDLIGTGHQATKRN